MLGLGVMTADDLARQARAAERARAMVIKKGQLGEPEVDFSPVSGGAALSLLTRLTIESFSLAGVAALRTKGDRSQARFVPRTRA